jgi:uridine kinase
LLRARLFWLGLLARVVCLPFFGSYVSRALFIPFLDNGLMHPGENPWALLPPHYFPYGSVLYVLLAVPRALAYAVVGDVALGTTPVSLALLKAPLLVLDAVLLALLVQIAPKRRDALVLYYWLNPILFFITYLHGQLDVAATAFCVAALFALMHRRTVVSAVLMAAATLCKAHVSIIAPFVLYFMWQRTFARAALRQMATWALVWGSLSALGLWPHLDAGALGYVTTASPEAFRIFGAQLDLDRSGHIFYVGVAVLLVLLGRLCISTQVTELGLLFGSGLLFGMLLLITDSQPGWYFWPMPFVALLYANYVVPPVALFWTCCLAYLSYFGLLQMAPSSWPSLLHGNVFTLLQTCFGGLMFAMWYVAVRHEAPLDARARPVLVGIAGDSGTGKDCLSQVVSGLFEPRSTAVLEGDDYHKWERGNAKWTDYTHLDPKANYLDELAVHTTDLLNGRLVWQPHYDHGRGTFTAPREIRGNKLVIVQGLHALYLRDMRAQLDLKIFLAPHPLVRLAWKIRRDVAERGHSVDRVLRSLEARQQDAEVHINPQRAAADWIIEALPAGEPPSREAVIAGAQVPLRMRYILWNDAPVTELYEALRAQPGCQASLNVVTHDIDRIMLDVEGEPSAEAIETMGKQLFAHLRTVTRSRRPPRWQAGYAGLQQLVALALLNKRATSGAALRLSN